MTEEEISSINGLNFDRDGLIPAIIQDYNNGRVLMMAYMNEESLKKTIETGRTHFFSRSRKRLWEKGETSGHYQVVKSIYTDCDKDTLLIEVEQHGNACHTGNMSCFYRGIAESPPSPPFTKGGKGGFSEEKLYDSILSKVYDIIIDRKLNSKSDSYVSSLFEKGKDRILKKIGEEAGEVIIGSKNNDKENIIYEIADLWFHTMVVMGYHGITLQDIYDELGRRYNTKKVS
ncbi:MAG: bifunctional phosphoribosyl-AMP cyclohydrolase/phosphoribosyl-ATP diphosphatase HisIE [Nitrospirota bacterium]